MLNHSTWRRFSLCIPLLLALGCVDAQSSKQSTKDDQAATKDDKAATKSRREEPIKARNIVTLRQKVGEEVSVAGRVARTGKSRSGNQFLNFANTEFTVVCLSQDVKKFGSQGPADTYEGKDVVVTGKLELYRGKVQIQLREPSQIKTAEIKDQPTGIKLKKVGENHWESPAGLVYRGKDPAGLTRVEHVARHARDIPDRDGPHGVFDGGEEVAFAVIDEAWKIVKQKKLRGNREGDRSAYTVRMDRRVGYLGGKLGAARGHPPLDRVFIVVEAGTSNVITAFPR